MTDGCGLWLGYGYRQVRGRFFFGGGVKCCILYIRSAGPVTLGSKVRQTPAIAYMRETCAVVAAPLPGSANVVLYAVTPTRWRKQIAKPEFGPWPPPEPRARIFQSIAWPECFVRKM